MVKNLTASSGNFGNVPEFTEAQKTIEITNTGTEFITITETVLEESEFFSQTQITNRKLYPEFPVSSDIYADENGRIQDVNGEFYTVPTSPLSYKIGSTDTTGLLTLNFQATLFGFVTPLDGEEIQYNVNLPISVNYPISTASINLYYTINSGVSIAIATESNLKSFNLDLSALTLEEGDTITLTMIDFDDPSTTAEIDINIVEKTIEITNPLNDSVLKIDKNINLYWDYAHVNIFEIYTALNSELYTLLAERTSNNFIITPDMIEAEEGDILHIKVKDKDSDIFDSIDVELKNAFIDITTPLNLSSVQLDIAFNILGNTNAQYVNIYATSATVINELIAENVEVVAGIFTTEIVLLSSVFAATDEAVKIKVADNLDLNNNSEIYLGIEKIIDETVYINMPELFSEIKTEYTADLTKTLEITSEIKTEYTADSTVTFSELFTEITIN